MHEIHAPWAQTKYQIRFDHGPDAANRVAGGTDVVVLVDAVDAPGAGVFDVSEFPAGVPEAAAVLRADLRDARAAAAWVLAEQQRRERRVFVAILAAGGESGAFAADDLLAAGALVTELTSLGLDDTSPEAAVAAAAYGGLRRAVRHLVSASGSGRAAVAGGAAPAEIAERAVLDSSETVRVLRSAT